MNKLDGTGMWYNVVSLTDSCKSGRLTNIVPLLLVQSSSLRRRLAAIVGSVYVGFYGVFLADYNVPGEKHCFTDIQIGARRLFRQFVYGERNPSSAHPPRIQAPSQHQESKDPTQKWTTGNKIKDKCSETIFSEHVISRLCYVATYHKSRQKL